MTPQAFKYQLLAELLHSMEAEGRVFGTDQHLRWQELIAQLPEEVSERQLNEIFCPLFAKSEQEQKAFNHIFEQAHERVKAVNEPFEPLTQPIQEKTTKLKWLIGWLAAILFLLAAFPVYLWLQSIQPPKEIYTYRTIIPGIEQEVCVDTAKIDTFGNISTAVFHHTRKDRHENEFGKYAVGQSGCLSVIAKDTVGKDSLCIAVQNRWRQKAHLYFILTYERPNSTEFTDQTDVEAPLFSTKPLPHPESDIRVLEIKPPSKFVAFLIKYQLWFKLAFIVVLALLLWALVKWREQRRRKLVAELESKTKPPYVWNIRIDGLEEPEMNDAYFSALHKLRRRTGDEHFYLDMPATIGATIDRAGFTEFRYGQHTRPPEYLLLIDRQTAANHRAQLFDHFFQLFKRNGVLTERFFYDSEPKLCYNENFPNGLNLSELEFKYSGYRLLVVGSGYSLLSPLTGKLAKWTEFFTKWKYRSLLSPTPTKTWGRREEQLQELFMVLPASMQGLNFLIEHLDADDETGFDRWREKLTDAPAHPIELQGGLMSTLRTYYSEDLLKWIAACAVYPSLHYDLTLYLGSLLSTSDHNLVTVGNLSELNRLAWFVEGKIPQEARAVLLDFLEQEHPETLLKIREGLHQLLSKNQPPEDSVAWLDYRMTAALNEWLFIKDEKRKKELEKEIATLLDGGIEADFTIVKYLDRKRSPLDFIVPDTWKKYLKKRGYAISELDEVWREVLKFFVLPAAFVVLSVFLFGWKVSLPDCKGEMVNYKGMTLCVNSDEDRVLYYEYLGRDAIETGNLVLIDSFVYSSVIGFYRAKLKDLAEKFANDNSKLGDSLIPNNLRDSSIINELKKNINSEEFDGGTISPLLDSVQQIARKNLAATLYNKGVWFVQKADSIQQKREAGFGQVMKDTACAFFYLADDIGTPDIDVQKAVAWCERNEPSVAKVREIVGKVVDSKSRKPIAKVKVTVIGSGQVTTTNIDGIFSLTLNMDKTNNHNIQLEFVKEKYQSHFEAHYFTEREKVQEFSMESIPVAQLNAPSFEANNQMELLLNTGRVSLVGIELQLNSPVINAIFQPKEDGIVEIHFTGQLKGQQPNSKIELELSIFDNKNSPLYSKSIQLVTDKNSKAIMDFYQTELFNDGLYYFIFEEKTTGLGIRVGKFRVGNP